MNDKNKSVKLILHPGHNKCGSSSIQSFLYSNIDELAKQGVYLPDRDFKFLFEAQKSQLNLQSPIFYLQKIIEQNNFSYFEKRVSAVLNKAEESNCKAIIISAENLSNGSGVKKGRKIHEILASYFLEKLVIYHIRRQDEFLVSSWQQWGHKRGETLTYHIEQALDRYNPDFLGTARFFEELYGEDSVIVLPLNKKAFKDENLITDFCDRSRLELKHGKHQNQASAIHRNKGLNPYLCDILSRIPHIYKDQHDGSVKRLITHYLETNEILFANDKTILGQEYRSKILKTFEQDNHTLRDKYFDDLSYDDVWGEKNEIESKHQLDYLADNLEHLKDITALQMELIINLLREQEKIRYKAKKQFSLKVKVRRGIDKVKEFWKKATK